MQFPSGRSASREHPADVLNRLIRRKSQHLHFYQIRLGQTLSERIRSWV